MDKLTTQQSLEKLISATKIDDPITSTDLVWRTIAPLCEGGTSAEILELLPYTKVAFEKLASGVNFESGHAKIRNHAQIALAVWSLFTCAAQQEVPTPLTRLSAQRDLGEVVATLVPHLAFERLPYSTANLVRRILTIQLVNRQTPTFRKPLYALPCPPSTDIPFLHTSVIDGTEAVHVATNDYKNKLASRVVCRLPLGVILQNAALLLSSPQAGENPKQTTKMSKRQLVANTATMLIAEAATNQQINDQEKQFLDRITNNILSRIIQFRTEKHKDPGNPNTVYSTSSTGL